MNMTFPEQFDYRESDSIDERVSKIIGYLNYITERADASVSNINLKPQFKQGVADVVSMTLTKENIDRLDVIAAGLKADTVVPGKVAFGNIEITGGTAVIGDVNQVIKKETLSGYTDGGGSMILASENIGTVLQVYSTGHICIPYKDSQERNCVLVLDPDSNPAATVSVTVDCLYI